MKAKSVLVAAVLGVAAPFATSGCVSGSKGGGSSWFGGSSYKLPAYEEKKLANGLQVLFVPDHSLPYISFSVLVRAGAVNDPAGLPGVAAMVAELLDKGTTRRSAPKIAEDFGQIGADFDASASSEYTMVSASALSTKADELLTYLFEILTEPTFSDAEIERMRRQTLASLRRLEDNPNAFSDRVFRAFLFESHPYARPIFGNLKSVTNIKKKHIIQHYLRYYRPNNVVLAVVGKYTPEFAANVEKVFGAWEQREVPTLEIAAPASSNGRRVLLVDKPGLVQAQLRIGHTGIERKSEDFLAVRVANTILGGAFMSRLNNRIRRELGLTYSIHSRFEALHQPGMFEISTFTKNESVGQTIEETLKVLAEFKKDGVTADEVEAAKGYLKGVFPQTIETPEKLALNLLQLRLYGIPDSYLKNYLKELDSLSVSTINRAIKKHFDDENIKIVVYASAKATRPQLKVISNDLVEKKPSDFQ